MTPRIAVLTVLAALFALLEAVPASAAPPTAVSSGQVASWKTESTSKRFTLDGLEVGDTLAAYGLTEDQSITAAISGRGLTWTQRRQVNVGNHGRAYVWTATAITAGSLTLTCRRGTAGGSYGCGAVAYRDSDGIGASAKANGTGAPALSFATMQDDSALLVANVDWLAFDGERRAWRTSVGPLSELTYERSSRDHTVYAARHPAVGAIGGKTVGLTAPGRQRYSIVAVEIKGTANPPPKQCEDRQDNDGDGGVDLADRGCADPSDDDESDDPPPTETTAPETTITDGPSSGPSTSVWFAFTSNDADSTFECRMDLQASGWEPCVSPTLYSDLPRGSHTFQVRATDAAGVTDASPASHTWRVTDETLPPDPTVWPHPSNTGLPSGWTPKQTVTSDMTITQDGAVIEDVSFDRASVNVVAENVTFRRVRFRGGGIDNQPGREPCGNGMLIEDSNFEPPPGLNDPVDQDSAVKWGGYTARNVKVWRRGEGFFVSGDVFGCDPVHIEDSFASLVIPPQFCGPGTEDWHTDGIQGYGGDDVYVRNVTIDSREADCGTAPFFYPDQGNKTAHVDRLLVMGGGYPFRLLRPGEVRGLRIVDRSWVYLPIDVTCWQVTSWEAKIVTIDSQYQPTVVRDQPCNTSG
jgi:hypothetical protein